LAGLLNVKLRHLLPITQRSPVTLNLALKYQKSEDELFIGFCDADRANDPDDRHSTTGHLFLSAGGVISWLSKKQAVVALSTSEAEYIALCFAAQEAV